jgi:predicted nucleic acid-binding protein
MIILDTNVLSALMSRLPDQQVIAWLDKQPTTSIWTTSVTVLEIRFGLQTMRLGKRRAMLMDSFNIVLDGKIDGRVASFDEAAAREAADLMARRQKRGRPGDLIDTMIAGIAMAQAATLATRNTSHFEDLTVSVINPWKSI